MRTAKTLIRLGGCPGWSVFAGRTCHFVGFVVRGLIYKLVSLSTLQTNTDPYVNSVDPDETARYEPSHQDLHCVPFWFLMKTETPIFNNGYVQILSWKRPLQILRDERIKCVFSVSLLSMNWLSRVTRKGSTDFRSNPSFSAHARPLDKSTCLILWLKFPLHEWAAWILAR